MATRPLIKESLSILHFCGVDPTRISLWSNSRIVAIQGLFLILEVELILQFIYNWKGLESIDGVGLALALYQLMVRHLVMVTNRVSLLSVLKNMDAFWPINKYGNRLQNETEVNYASIKKVASLMLSFLLISIVMYFVKPIVSAEKALPYDTYHPKNLSDSPDYELTYLLQLFTALTATLCVVGFDCLFVALIANIKYELKLIKLGFKKIGAKVEAEAGDGPGINLLEVNQLVEHHSLVLECIKYLNKIYSFLLLNMFSACMFCMCTSLLCISADGMPPSLDVLSKYGSFISVNAGQLFFYCLAGSHLITESEEVSQAVFEAGWWVKPQPKITKAYMLIIQRAHKMEKLSAGGMFDLNMENFKIIINNAFSFFTFLQAVYGPEGE